MKKTILLLALVSSISFAKSQTVFKIEVDTVHINNIWNGFAKSENGIGTKVAKDEQEKADFFYEFLLSYIKIKSSEVAGTKAADVARQAAIVDVESKPIVKGK